jgi:hypothetical protein
VCRIEKRLVADNAQAFDFFVHAFGVVHVPRAGNELRRHCAHIGDGDGVREHVHPPVWVRLLRQVLGLNVDLKFVAWHAAILNEIITP